MLESVRKGPVDPMYDLKVAVDSDNHPNKVDLGAGIYKNEQGRYHELDVLREAKKKLFRENPPHDYEVTTGNAAYLQHATKVIFGDESSVLQQGKVASVQTISGTGAVHLGAQFLAKCVKGVPPKVYVGTPAWGNYEPLFRLVGFEVETYSYLNPASTAVDFESVIHAVRRAAPGSVFVLQACGHNPTAIDMSRAQWEALAREMKARGLFAFFDIAYQGIANSVDDDAFAVRLFAGLGFEMLVCQTFSKSFGLYGERVGALHVVCPTPDAALAVFDQLRCLIRWEFSSTPAYGARLVNMVLEDQETTSKWHGELSQIRQRIKALRQQLHYLLTTVHQTPGDWTNIINGQGLFSFLPLNPQQCHELRSTYHIYLVPNGRINVSGLSERNIGYVAENIDRVVRGRGKTEGTSQLRNGRLVQSVSSL